MPDFDAFRERLEEASFRESEARRDEAAFGSWLIALDTEPPLRVVWDGNDRWLIVQAHRDDKWRDERVIREDAEQTTEAVIRSLESLRAHS
jgi:hypothetical protein